MFQLHVTEEAAWTVAKMRHKEAIVLLLRDQFWKDRERKRE